MVPDSVFLDVLEAAATGLDADELAFLKVVKAKRGALFGTGVLESSKKVVRANGEVLGLLEAAAKGLGAVDLALFKSKVGGRALFGTRVLVTDTALREPRLPSTETRRSIKWTVWSVVGTRFRDLLC